MNITAFDIYLLLKLDEFVSVFSGLSVLAWMVFSIVGAISAIAYAMNKDMAGYGEKYATAAESWKTNGLRIGKILLPTAIILTILSTLIPTTKQAIAMFSIPAVANSEMVAKGINITEKSLDLLDVKIDQMLSKAKAEKDAVKKEVTQK